MLYPFHCLKLEQFKVHKYLSRRISRKSDFKAKSMAELKEQGVLVVEIPASAAKMVLTLELNLERNKTGDVGKFHTYMIIGVREIFCQGGR